MKFTEFEDKFYDALMKRHEFVDIELKDHTHIYSNRYEYESQNFVRLQYHDKALPYIIPVATVNLDSIDKISDPRGK